MQVSPSNSAIHKQALPADSAIDKQALPSGNQNVRIQHTRSRIRPFIRDDIPQVADLIIRFFSFARNLSNRFVSDALEEVIINNPWADENIPSLVYQHTDGTVKGFLGLSPRKMIYQGEKVTQATTHNFVVEPGTHALVTGVKLFKTALNGPQDFIISGSAGDTSKYITEKNGGTISYMHSCYWRLPIRPMLCGLKYIGRGKSGSNESVRHRSIRRVGQGSPEKSGQDSLKRGGQSSLAVKGLRKVASAGDGLLGRVVGAPFRYQQPDGYTAELTASDLVACLRACSDSYSLHPDYTPETLRWVLTTVGKADHLGILKSIGVYDTSDRFAGWFILFCNPGGNCEVLQWKAKKGKESYVLDHLIYYTWQNGGAELTGRLDPEFIRPVSKSWAFYRPGRVWMILHGRMDIISAICRGDAFISRMEDDLWLL